MLLDYPSIKFLSSSPLILNNNYVGEAELVVPDVQTADTHQRSATYEQDTYDQQFQGSIVHAVVAKPPLCIS